MSELALRKYVADSVTTNLTLPTGTGRYKSFTAHKQMLKRDVLGSHVVLQVGRMHAIEKRLAGARGLGTKQADWKIDLLVVANGKNVDADSDDFSVLVNSIVKIFRTTVVIPATLTDPQTAETSILTHIGELIELEELDPDMEAVQGRILFRARVTLDAVEIISPF